MGTLVLTSLGHNFVFETLPSMGCSIIFSWEPALETVMSVDRVLLLMMRSKNNHCTVFSTINSDF